ncbi:MAG: hypothetical protein IVW54_05135 [Candidatus Binataceae bacterium]|nr:hypothetical protein [Candidatus Binataceae bacterium]
MDQLDKKAPFAPTDHNTIAPHEPNLAKSVIQRARAMVPWLREQAPAMERERRAFGR